jgi:FAD binding domain
MSEKFAESVRAQLSGDAVDTSEETIARYGFNRLPGGDRRPSGVVFPASTADVQVILRLAGLHGMSLWPISTGHNIGLGECTLYSRSDAAEGNRMRGCYAALVKAYDEIGCPIGRTPTDWQEFAMRRLPALSRVCRAIKVALDPNGIIAPGKYGIA